MVLEQEHSIFDNQSLYKKFKATDTKFNVVDGKISSIISDSEIEELVDESHTVYSRLNARVETVEGYKQQISDVKTTAESNESKISTLEQKTDKINIAVSSATTGRVDLNLGEANLLLNSSFSENFDEWSVSGSGWEITTEDGYKCAHISGGISATKYVKQYFQNRIKEDVDKQLYTISADIKLVNYVAGDNPLVGVYFGGSYIDSGGTSQYVGATYKDITPNKMFPDYSDKGWIRVYYSLFFQHKPSIIAFNMYARNWTGNLYFKNVQLQRGSRATDWSPAPNDISAIESRVASAELAIQPDQIYSTVKQATSWTDDRQGDIDAAVGEAQRWTKSSESGIMQKADAIKMFVQESDVNGNYVVGKINLDSTTAKIQARNINLQGAVSISDFDTSTQKLVNSHDMRFFTTAYQWDQAGIDNVANIGHVTTWTVKESIDDLMVGNTVIIQLYNKTKKIDSYLMAEVTEVVSVSKKQIKCSCIGLLERGLDGLKGDTGVGIDSVTNYYLASSKSSGVTRDTSGWDKNPSTQTLSEDKKYLWNYEDNLMTDNSHKYVEPHIISMFAKDGVVGKDGVSITEVKEFFARSTGTSASTIVETFTNTALQLTSTYKYLWNYEVVYFSDGTSKSNESKKRIIGVYGDKGADGVSIASITNYYLASASASGVTRSTSGWKTDPSTQTLTETKKYLWNYEDNLMTDNSHKYVEPRVISTYAKNGVSVTKVEEYFARSTDNTESSIMEAFSTKALKVTPVYKYLWNYEVVYFSDGTSTSNESKKRIIGVYGDTGAKGADGAAGMSVKSSTPQYYLSWKTEEPAGGSWLNAPPAWKSGWVYWERVHTVLEGPSGSTDIYSTPVLSQGLNKACKDANSAATTLAKWAHKNNTTLIDGSNIYTGTIGALQIASKAITADKIEADTIDASKIKTDALVGKILYATNYGDTTYWNPTIYYRNSQKKDANDRESLWDNSDWTTSIPAYKSSVPYLWAYARINASGKRKNWTIPICIGYRTSSGIQYYTNLALANGKIWSYTNENYLSLDGRAADSAANDRAFLASPDGYVSVSKEKGGAVHHAVDIYTSGCISMQGDDKVFITALDGDLRLTPGDGRYVAIYGKMTATGNKARLVQDTLYGDRLQYSYETPTPMFGDVGLGQLDENGEATIAIDDIFNETVNTSIEYAVFLQKEGPGDVWIDEKTELYFTVKGTPGLKFAWELKAVQKGYEQDRLNDFALEDNDPIDDTALTRTLNEDFDNSLKEVDNLSSDLDKEMEELLNAETSVESISGD